MNAPASIAALAVAILAYPDCALPDDCTCRRRGYPNGLIERTSCLVPSINAQARELGWREPYPPAGSDAAKFRNLLADLDVALREGLTASLAGDLPAAEAAMRRSSDLLAIVRIYEGGNNAKSV